LPFAWKDLPFSSWKEILYRISSNDQAAYQLVWFIPEFLGIDVVSLIRNDPRVNETAREVVRVHFPGGGPGAGTAWTKDLLHDNGVDQPALWRRLAAEGAPMKVDLSKLD